MRCIIFPAASGLTISQKEKLRNINRKGRKEINMQPIINFLTAEKNVVSNIKWNVYIKEWNPGER